jgi:hypothetical protein
LNSCATEAPLPNFDAWKYSILMVKCSFDTLS